MFKNRKQAGILLAKELKKNLFSFDNCIVIALPKGGVPVAFEIAKELNLPMDIISVKKIGAPNNPELAIGAVCEKGNYFLNKKIVQQYNINNDELNLLISKAQKEAKILSEELRSNNKQIKFQKKNVIIVDDGIATGATIKACIKLLKKQKINKILVAVPVCSRESYLEIKKEVDGFSVLEIPNYFSAVGDHFNDFHQVSRKEVISLLMRNNTNKQLRYNSSIDTFENEGGLIYEKK